MTTPLISVLINSKNGESNVRRLLDSLLLDSIAANGEIEILLLDDGSEPRISALPVSQQFYLPVSLGVGGGRNFLAGKAQGKYLLFLDDDVEFIGCDTLQRAILSMKQRNDDCLLAFCELTPDRKRFWQQPSNANCPSRIGKFCGFAFLMPRNLWEKCGGFEATLFYQHEEIDLSYRIFENGYWILYDPCLAMVHHRKINPSQQNHVHQWVLRNMLFTAILRFPIYLIPFQTIKSIRLYFDFSQEKLIAKLKTISWAFQQLFIKAPSLLRSRHTVSLNTLKKVRELNKTPLPID